MNKDAVGEAVRHQQGGTDLDPFRSHRKVGFLNRSMTIFLLFGALILNTWIIVRIGSGSPIGGTRVRQPPGVSPNQGCRDRFWNHEEKVGGLEMT